MSDVPISAHALLSDCHSAALVSRDGSVDWLCFPRFDSPSVFGRLLDDAGRALVDPPGRRIQVTRRYVDQTMVLETTFRTATGTVDPHRRAGHRARTTAGTHWARGARTC